MENVAMRLLMTIAATAAALFAAGCTASTAHPAASPAPVPADPRTASALLKIATAFNHEYDSGDYGPVYARWDARSQAIITRAGYIRRHKERFSSGDLAGLQDVDGFGDLPGAPGAAAELAQDSPGLELGVGALTGSTQLRVGGVGGLLGSRLVPAPVRGQDVLACADVALISQHD